MAGAPFTCVGGTGGGFPSCGAVVLCCGDRLFPCGVRVRRRVDVTGIWTCLSRQVSGVK